MLVKQSVMFAKKTWRKKCTDDTKYCKVRDHCHYASKYWGAAITYLRYSIPKEFPIAFYTGINYDFFFLIS